MASNSYTEEQLIKAIRDSESIRQVLLSLGLAPRGGNYSTVKRAIERLGLDTSHFLGQRSNRHRVTGPKRPLQDYLDNKYRIHSHSLRLRLLLEGIFEPRCHGCGGTEWLGKPIPLELEHINGVHEDNSLSNLTLLCPNCHAQTATYRGKNIARMC